MGITAKYGAWDNATYPWDDQTSAGVMGSIVTEIDAWITAIGSNVSITTNGMLPVKQRDPASSTNSGTTNGFVYEFPDTSIGLNALGSTYPHLMFYGTQTSLTAAVTDEYGDDTSNNGYGTYGSTSGHYSLITGSGDAGYNNQAIVIYNDVNGEEFLCVAIKHGAGVSDENTFVVFKDKSNRWCFSVRNIGFAYDNYMDYWTGGVGPYDTDPTMGGGNTSLIGPMYLSVSTITGAAGKPGYDGIGQGMWYPASDKLYAARGTTARWGEFRTAETGEQYMSLGYLGSAVLIPV